jgi:hypothetical protein
VFKEMLEPNIPSPKLIKKGLGLGLVLGLDLDVA